MDALGKLLDRKGAVALKLGEDAAVYFVQCQRHSWDECLTFCRNAMTDWDKMPS
jgi:hypothetical protein